MSTNSESSYYSNSEVSISSDENLDHSDNLELNNNIIKNYNVICELGRGSFSIVWLAYNIDNNNFYALKVQNPTEYESGIEEIKFVSKLPQNPNVFNNLIEYFIEKKDGKKFLCSVWELHCSNIDSLLRKGNFQNGFSINIVKKIMKQLIVGLKILHNKFKVFHGDIKTDNILIKGINNKNQFIIQNYKNEQYLEKYIEAKKKFWINLGKDLKNISKMKKEDKIIIRKQIHQDIMKKILPQCDELSPYTINDDYLKLMNISLADFGTYCEEDNYYEESFGTRYYQAPEIILMGKCSYPVDIWALGCTFFELLSGNILFDPIKDSKYSRDYYHLCLINETCGNYPIKFLQNTKYYKNFFNSKGKLMDYIAPDENRLDRKLNELLLDPVNKETIKEILINMLNIDPNKRWTINDLDACSFFN